MIFDTHSHLFSEEFDNDREECLKRCDELNIKLMLVGYSHIGNQQAYDLAQKNSNYYCSAGIHPDQASPNYLKDIELLEAFLDSHKVNALGEIGLDYHYDDTDREKQIMVFRKQLDIAQKYDKPIIVHSRDSIQDTYNILKEYNLKGSIHCFSGSVEMAREFIKLGYKIGIGGIITYKNAKTIKEVVKDTDLAYILLETDSPYLAPVPHRGEDNNPKYIPIIADEIASIKGTSGLDIARVTTANAEAVFDFFCEK